MVQVLPLGEIGLSDVGGRYLSATPQGDDERCDACNGNHC